MRSNCGIAIPVVNLIIKNRDKCLSLPFLLDTGSQFSIINAKFTDALRIKGVPMNKFINSVGFHSRRKGSLCKMVLVFPDEASEEVQFFSLHNLDMHMRIKGMSALLKHFKNNKVGMSPSLPSYENDSIEIAGVIGTDILAKFKVFEWKPVLGGTLIELSNGFIPVGPIVDMKSYGISASNLDSSNLNDNEVISIDESNFEKITSGSNINKAMNFVLNSKPSYYSPLCEVFPESSVEHGLEHLFALESIGISNENSSAYDDNQTAKFASSIEIKDGHYSIDLPWHQDILSKVPSNYEVSKAIARKVHLKNKEKMIDDSYFEVFQNQLELGIIEPIDSSYDPEDHIWIPHRPVVREDPFVTTTKVRPVFNCSLKTGGAPSLNEAAYPGTDLMSDLMGLLNYFRINKYVLLADIAKAFLMIKLKSNFDKNKFSFLLFRNGKYLPYRYNTIIFGFISSPFILNFIIKYHAKACNDSLVSQALASKFYVDNLIYSCNTEEEALHLFKNASSKMDEVGFKLRQWCSNSSNIRSEFNPEDSSEDQLVKVLGYIYDPKLDTLSVKMPQLDKNASTKRGILSNVSSVFDPLGLLSPISVKGKLIMRDLHALHLGWDSPVPRLLVDKWKAYCNEFNCLPPFSSPRQVFSTESPTKLVIFVDASKEAYGFAIYACQFNSARLLLSKVKVSPNPAKTLPTLELLSSFLALQCAINLLSEPNYCKVRISSVTVLTDSQVALAWLLSGKAMKKNVFVNNRLKDIQTFKDKFNLLNIDICFSYIPTEHNVADFLTRGLKAKHFMENLHTWIYGPSWICCPNSEWPTGLLGCVPSKFCRSPDMLAVQLTTPSETSESLSEFDSEKFFQRFSSYTRLLNVTMKIFEAVRRFKKSPVINDEIKSDAFNFLIKKMQSSYFSKEISFLQGPTYNVHQVPPLINQLNLFLDLSGFVRSKGRIEKNFSLNYDAVNPILLHRESHFTKLIILQAHWQSKHLGVSSTMNLLRQGGFWIPKVRSAIESVLHSCFVCKRFNNRPFRPPSTPVLPIDRVNFIKPFQHTGIDFTGNFKVYDQALCKQKMYILIFTCMNTRAIHLELVKNMSTEEFILAFIRFCNRFTIPDSVYSDNAKTFLSGAALLQEIFSSNAFSDKYKTHNIKFKNIPIYSAWYGATWERLIKVVKDCLYKTIGRLTLSYFNLLTTLSDIQLVINNRPLTYRTKDNELDILTPNHLISVGNSFPSLIITADQDTDALDSNPEELRENILSTLELRDAFLVRFKNVWSNDYLLALREHHRDSYETPNTKQSAYLKPGSVVLLRSPIKSRPFWTFVQIVDITPSSDNKIRSVRIKRPNGSISTSSIVHLYPLELDVNVDDVPLSVSADLITEHIPNSAGILPDNIISAPIASSSENNVPLEEENQLDKEAFPFVCNKSGRPVRQAAKKFMNKLHSWIQEDEL